jgi:hypothetical protein
MKFKLCGKEGGIHKIDTLWRVAVAQWKHVEKIN